MDKTGRSLLGGGGVEGEVAVGKTRGSRWRKAERAMVMVQGAAEGGRHKTAQERMKKRSRTEPDGTWGLVTVRFFC